MNATLQFLRLTFLLAAPAFAAGLDGQPGIHDPSTLAQSNGKFYTYGTGGTVMKTALYFDSVNFASRIKAPVLAGMGFIDTISPPAGIWTALNQVRRAKEPLAMIESEHDNLTPQKGRACPVRTREILDLIVKGGEYQPRTVAFPK